MTLLTMVSAAAQLIGIPAPGSVIGNSSPQVQELLACAQDEGFDLMRRGAWQVLDTNTTFSAVATAVSGTTYAIQTGAVPSDYDRFLQETFWNRTRKRPLYGPVTAQEWQNLVAWTSSPVVDTFRFVGSQIWIIPAPTAGDVMAYEYISKNWCQSSGGTGQSEWLADTDTGVLDEDIMKLGVVWRFKQKKGLPFMADYDKWDARARQALVQDMPQRTINFGSGVSTGRRPGISVPEGSWDIT
jgi:hypothetical protein